MNPNQMNDGNPGNPNGMGMNMGMNRPQPNFQVPNSRSMRDERKQRAIQRERSLAQANSQAQSPTEFGDIFSVFDSAMQTNLHETKARLKETQAVTEQEKKESQRRARHNIMMCMQMRMQQELYGTVARTNEHVATMEERMENRDVSAGTYNDAISRKRPLPSNGVTSETSNDFDDFQR